MSDNADVPRGPRPVSNAISHAESDRRRPTPDWMEPQRSSGLPAAEGGVVAGGFGGAERNAERSEPADNPRPNGNEWAQAKNSFTSLFDETDAMVRMFDQEKKHVLGLTHALSQIQDSFEKLHGRFTDVENRVESFENISGRLSYRMESTFDTMQDCKNNEAELAKDHLALRAALEAAERKWAQHFDSIRVLTEENRILRDALAAVERDNKLIVAEMANEMAKVHAKLALIEEQVDIESLFVAPGANASRSLPVQPEQAALEPQRAPRETAPPNPAGGDIDKQIAELNDSIEFHRNELGRMQLQAENLMAGMVAADPPGRRPASGRSEAMAAVSSRAASAKKLAELKALSSTYQSLVQDLEMSRASLTHPGSEPDDAAEPDAGAADDSEPLRAAPSRAIAGGTEFHKINSMRSMYERRTEDLKAELTQERRERKFAECALRVARAERLHLQHEIAKVRAVGWRKISTDAAAPEPAPSHEPEAVKRRINAA